ncbi:MAG: thioredoxin domain-containing protein [Cyanobacteria bacterium REEB446]|nr:thioredoxin domain-containing protein [Cyanobacteria bacterium REEB446]
MNYTIEKVLQDLPQGEDLKKIPEDGGDEWNRLVFEKSPYLLQHAANPVDWHPWSETAFAKAKVENKAIFLSIGYSTCHWCHVMEHESFEDEDVAKVLNQHFICIKVDREERPDIDSLYMGIAQMLISRGGWPLNLFLTPEKHVFYAGTYFPKLSKLYPNGYEMPGLIQIAHHLGEMWLNDKEKLEATAEKISVNYRKYHLGEDSSSELVSEIDKEIFNLDKNESSEAFRNEIQEISDKAFMQLSHQFDNKYGGFGPAPKFFSPHVYSFLLKYYERLVKQYPQEAKEKISTALDMVLKSLTQFRLGGVFDQLGYGFHRYSTDREWLLPHFEKMLYDQATLMLAYSDTVLVLEKLYSQKIENSINLKDLNLNQEKLKNNISVYKRVLDEIYEYLVTDMLSSENLFFSAEDADSEGEEGLFYTWTMKELKEILNKDELTLIVTIFQVEEKGNFLDESTKEKTGRNILHRKDLNDFLVPRVEKLYAHRKGRIHPLKDDKILTDWNSLMVAALARAYQATQDTKFLNLALKVTDSLLKIMRKPNGELLKSSRLGISSPNISCINDYSFFIFALIELIKASEAVESTVAENAEIGVQCLDTEKLINIAIDTQEIMFRKFWDDHNGAFFYADKEARELPLANKEFFDGAIPSGNSIAFCNLIELFKLTNKNIYLDKLNSMIKIMVANTKQYPTGYGQALVGLESLLEFKPTYQCDENGCRIL